MPTPDAPRSARLVQQRLQALEVAGELTRRSSGPRQAPIIRRIPRRWISTVTVTRVAASPSGAKATLIRPFPRLVSASSTHSRSGSKATTSTPYVPRPVVVSRQRVPTPDGSSVSISTRCVCSCHRGRFIGCAMKSNTTATGWLRVFSTSTWTGGTPGLYAGVRRPTPG